MTLEDEVVAHKKGGSFWSPEEMFEKNRREHDYKTSWDEHEYTTKIDKSDPRYHEKMAMAKRLANEIERGIGVAKSNNPHVLHDRGIDIDLDGKEEVRASWRVSRSPRPTHHGSADGYRHAALHCDHSLRQAFSPSTSP